MARTPRIVVPGLPHHITQRGVRRGTIFFSDEHRLLYLDILEFYVKKVGALSHAYCERSLVGASLLLGMTNSLPAQKLKYL
jgi:hypothetical protein